MLNSPLNYKITIKNNEFSCFDKNIFTFTQE